MSKCLPPMFSSRSFMVSGLKFESLFHFLLIWEYGVSEWSNFILLHEAVQFSLHHLLKRLSFPHCIFLAPLLSINWPYMHGFISGSLLCSIDLCLFLCQYHTVLITTVISFEIRACIHALFFFLKISLTIRSLLWFHTNFRTVCSIPVKNATEICKSLWVVWTF